MTNSSSISDTLTRFVSEKKFRGQGPLSVALVITQHARKLGLPLDTSKLVTDGGGQVLGLGKGAVQSVLARHGIKRVLSQEAGRTSRGSIGNMQAYVALLNELQKIGIVDLDAIEAFWIGKVHEFFAGKPFKLRVDAARGLRAMVRDVIAQAQERRKTNPSVHYVGAVMQHLVGAKLDCALGIGQFVHNSFSTSDAQSGRAGDFLIGDVAVHVTASPGDAVLAKCCSNLDDGLRAIIVTLEKGASAAEVAADNAGIAGRVDIFEVEQFIALNLYELGRFKADGRRVAVEDLVKRYNAIVEEVETDPSFLIELRI